MWKKIALKDLKQIKRDKKGALFNIILPLFIIIAMASVSYFFSANEKESKIGIVTNSDYIQEKFNNNKNYSIVKVSEDENIIKEVEKEKDKIGVLWSNENVKFIINSDAENEIYIARDDIFKTLELDNVSILNFVDIKQDSQMVNINYTDIAKKLTASICGFLLIIIVFRFNNVNSFYLTTNEKNSGTLEVLLSTPIKAKDIILGKWMANFISALSIGLMIFVPVYICLGFIFQIALGTNINILEKLPISIFECIILTLIISLVQLFLGFIAKSIKMAQVYLAYFPIGVLIPLMIMLGMDMKRMSEYTLNSYIIDFIPILNFYDLFQLTIFKFVSIYKVIVILLVNLIFVGIIFRKLIKLFNSEKILIFKN
ncbi:ABC transporter permease [Clostridium perfringens]|uniref:ABC transporter permease n=1 Tax=Clostridium perfringens TaxID=1502 RepID=UPI0024BCB278|nr:ABC transporter permease [Clostridium perfringens]ELC8463951.1 ABC transporter permease [Clostridium perfringens]